VCEQLCIWIGRARLLVYPSHSPVVENFVTKFASPDRCLVLSPEVREKVRLEMVFLSTMRAVERLFARVEASMRVAILLHREGTVAELALERLNLHVRSKVYP